MRARIAGGEPNPGNFLYWQRYWKMVDEIAWDEWSEWEGTYPLDVLVPYTLRTSVRIPKTRDILRGVLFDDDSVPLIKKVTIYTSDYHDDAENRTELISFDSLSKDSKGRACCMMEGSGLDVKNIMLFSIFISVEWEDDGRGVLELKTIERFRS
mgnify:CR=1 FL=1